MTRHIPRLFTLFLAATRANGRRRPTLLPMTEADRRDLDELRRRRAAEQEGHAP